mmetsp:Transcript_4475/g.10933  ORF Transcript_4475/g.10933 Transcript_4475/m.10933 type:complete len:417 (-) Transcript_4475:839-2089(-)|eukprot:CAMPEP_0178996458 /NCGR_PEP_ID=MMETSP0795-20121207/8376_1 /TAXON_ID=88552 /ORGANISM="Amoebophrya sp., Strain Ameob2" /LENGTH=416 /DNA_ID=CAMNT_0020688843 /DNA_START=495 /DNA_END=1745 /DNA_ORIENTATION=-
MSVSSNEATREQPEEQITLENPDVCTKYRTAADIANKALQSVLTACKEGADIFELCKLGDDTILEETGKVYNKKVAKKGDDDKKKGGDDAGKKMDKGIGFPTCVSVNEIAGHFSPLKNESKTLRSGDIVKVDLGVQIDGFLAQAGHTVLIPPEGDSPSQKGQLNENGKVADRRADVVLAAWTGAEAAVRMMQVGNTNTSVTQVIQQSADEFKCQPVSGVLSHMLNKNKIDDEKVIIGKETDDQKVDEFTFEVNQAYTLDILMSSGDGKTRETELRHTVYKRATDHTYILKTAKARQFISEVGKRFPHLPFSLANIEEEQCARVGVAEAKRHQLLHEYPVLTERPGEYIAQFKFTVLLLPGGTKKITGMPYAQSDVLESQYSVETESLKKLLTQSVAPRKKRANKKKADAPAAEEAA